MAVRQFGNARSTPASNYTIKKLPNGERIFATESQATAPGAIQLVRGKDSLSGKFKAGDAFYVTGANSVHGALKWVGVQDGFQKPMKNLVIGVASGDTGNTLDFVSLPLIREKGSQDSTTARLLAALKSADVGNPVDIVVYTFRHSKGDARNDGTVYEKDGDEYVLSAYQEHLKSADNENGRIVVTDTYGQTRQVVTGGQLVTLKRGEKAPEGATVIYDSEGATANAVAVAAEITARIRGIKNADAPVAAPAVTAFSDEDMEFGDEAPTTPPARMR